MSQKQKGPTLIPPNIVELCSLDYDDEVKTVRFNKQGKTIAATFRNQINLIAIEKLQQTNKLVSSDESEIFDVSWDSGGNTISSISEDNKVILWDVRENKQSSTVQGPKNENQFGFSLQFNPFDDNTLISTCFDNYVYIWDIRNMKKYQKMECGFNPITVAKFYNSGTIACGSLDGFIRTFDIKQQKLLKSVVIDNDAQKRTAVCSIYILSKFLLSGSLDNKIRLWQIDSQKMVKDYVGHTCEKYFLECSFLGKDYLMSGSQNGEVFVWYLNKHKVVAQQLKCFNADSKISDKMVLTMDEVRGQPFFSTGCADGTLKLWKMQPGQVQ
eukprot:TRINITY_DN5832_c0_g1_i2.p2 TRINITY_DN5832_c0_g1~~TRINITY_DN5832_c0_g1_i2.p2  ORF type:complete len:327 (-),score=31.23 TRINITY_DN5832_c0_g1_i2:218-1198(-)